MKKLFFLIGSSGSGKTTTAKLLEAKKLPDFIVLHSDSVHVPSSEEMIKEFGSKSEWQRNNTKKWVKKIKEEYLDQTNILFDIQSRPSFINEACEENDIKNYEIILFDCLDDERKKRLIQGRNSPELASDRMMDWARYLREVCSAEKCQIIDNTNLSPDQTFIKLLELVN